MKRGPKPKPTRLRLITGNAGRRPLPQHEPEAPPLSSDPPARLTEAAKPYWDQFAVMLREARIVTVLDETALVLLVEEYATWQQALAELRKGGMLTQGAHGGIVAHPAFKLARDGAARLHQLLVEFGMTPSSRSRVSTAPASREPDPWDEFCT